MGRGRGPGQYGQRLTLTGDMTNGAAALFMRTAYQNAAIYFGDTPLGGIELRITHALHTLRELPPEAVVELMLIDADMTGRIHGGPDIASCLGQPQWYSQAPAGSTSIALRARC